MRHSARPTPRRSPRAVSPELYSASVATHLTAPMPATRAPNSAPCMQASVFRDGHTHPSPSFATVPLQGQADTHQAPLGTRCKADEVELLSVPGRAVRRTALFGGRESKTAHVRESMQGKRQVPAVPSRRPIP
jgi:hypothetical protein